jgi:putative DNA-invertase from lambdoid prophage Rac
MAVYGYSRVSTTAQADEGESLEVQRRQVEGWCHMQGQVLACQYIERGVSGSIPITERPEGAIMWKRLQRGDMIIASKLDRLFRSALDALQTVAALKEQGVSLVLLDLGGDISGNGLSRLFLTIAAAFAEAERDRIRERVTQTKHDQKARGRYLGGKVPFGYRVSDGTLIGDQKKLKLIALAHRLRDEGQPLRAIQADLAARGAPLSIGGLHKMLQKKP